MDDQKIEVENVNTPGRTENVRADKYNDIHAALMIVLPNSAPGLSFEEMKTAAKEHLSSTLFPDGKTSGWWAKCVQLDLEAKGIVTRLDTKPLRFHKS